MKTKLLFLSIFMLLMVTTNYAQTSASQAGIAVQGIARDANNTAITSQNISFTFELYYFNSSNTEVPIYSETLNIQTDAFGVFSHVIDPGAVNSPKIANNLGYLRIKKGSEIISNEKLNHVPYAIAANNGVPVGAIMPFIGSEAPDGWAICNGDALPTTATELKALLGSNNTPDLRSLFLRGAGDDSRSQTTSVNLKAVQGDSNKKHNHSVNITTTNNGSHSHPIKLDTGGGGDQGVANMITATYGGNVGANYLVFSNSSGSHTHNVNGNTGNEGTESRPYNYGVNYIIKL